MVEMSYSFVLTPDVACRPKTAIIAKWPNVHDQNRTISLTEKDILCKQEDGKWTKQTGLCCMNIVIPDDAMTPIEKPIRLTIGSMWADK